MTWLDIGGQRSKVVPCFKYVMARASTSTLGSAEVQFYSFTINDECTTFVVLRSYEKFPRLHTRSKRYRSFVQYALSHYQDRIYKS